MYGEILYNTRVNSFFSRFGFSINCSFVLVPLMHVLAIHMKVMAPRQQLSDEWSALTGLWLNGREQVLS
jgi:hypothetical protein